MLNPARPFLISLRQRDLRVLFGGLVVSQAGDWLYNLALLAFVYERTGSTVWVGITTAARILPEVVLGPLGGVLADRHDRRMVMILSDVLRAASMAALAARRPRRRADRPRPVLAALCTAAGAAYPQCVVAVLPRLVGAGRPGRRQRRAHQHHGPVRHRRAGPRRRAAHPELGRRGLRRQRRDVPRRRRASWPRFPARRCAVPPAPSRRSHASIRADLAVGWRALREHPDALPLVGAEIVSSAVYGALTVLFVLIGERLGLGAAGYGYLLSALGVGGVLGGRPRAPRRLVGSPAPRAHRRGGGHRPCRSCSSRSRAPSRRRSCSPPASAPASSSPRSSPTPRSSARSIRPSSRARTGWRCRRAWPGSRVGALLAAPCVALIGLDATLALTGALVLAYGAVAFARPEPAPLLESA